MPANVDKIQWISVCLPEKRRAESYSYKLQGRRDVRCGRTER